MATEQVAATEKSLATMADYLRPGLLSVPIEARDSLYVAMSEAAVDDVPRVRAALDSCRAVDASWIHPDLQQRRDDYVGYLTDTVALLETVVEDGRLYYRDTPSSTRSASGCSARAEPRGVPGYISSWVVGVAVEEPPVRRAPER